MKLYKSTLSFLKEVYILFWWQTLLVILWLFDTNLVQYSCWFCKFVLTIHFLLFQLMTKVEYIISKCFLSVSEIHVYTVLFYSLWYIYKFVLSFVAHIFILESWDWQVSTCNLQTFLSQDILSICFMNWFLGFPLIILSFFLI